MSADLGLPLPEQNDISWWWPTGEFRHERELGAGAYGTAHLARVKGKRVRKSARQYAPAFVAIKLLEPGDQADMAHLCAGFRHPQIPRILKIVPLPAGYEYQVQEYVGKSTLRDRLRSGRLSAVDAVQCMLLLSDAIAYAYEMGIEAHRDIKPENIVLDRSRRPYIADWGLAFARGAKPFDPGQGTPGYMAPEVERRKNPKPSHRSDIWALGKILSEIVRDAEGDGNLKKIRDRCFADDPKNRYPKARDLRDALEDWLDRHGGWNPRWPYLLTPVVGPGVNDCSYTRLDAMSKSRKKMRARRRMLPTFAGAACEVRKLGERCLVLATQDGVLRTYAMKGDQYRPAGTVNAPEQETFSALVPLPRGKVGAIVHRREGDRGVLWTIDISVEKNHTRTPLGLAAAGRIEAVAILPKHPRLLVLTSEHHSGSGDFEVRKAVIRLVDLKGVELVPKMSLPFASRWAPRARVVAFAPEAWAVVGTPEPRSPQKLMLLRLAPAANGSRKVEPIECQDLGRVNGACAIPDDRLAVTHQPNGSKATFLSVIGTDGQVSLKMQLIEPQPATSGLPGLRRQRGASRGDKGVLYSCFPVGWHRDYGVILCCDHPSKSIYAIRLERNAKPESLPPKLSDELTRGSECWRYVLSLGIRKRRVLFVFEHGAIVLGPRKDDITRIEDGAMTDVVTRIIGCRGDGEVFIQDEWGDEGYVCRNRPSIARPPFAKQSINARPSRGEELRLTSDGCELRWSRDGAVLMGRQQAGALRELLNAAAYFGGIDRKTYDDQEFSKLESDESPAYAASNEGSAVEILDATGDGQGNLITAVQQGKHVAIVRLNSASQPDQNAFLVPPIADCRDVADIDLRAASRDLVIYDVVERLREPGERVWTRILDLASGRRWKWRAQWHEAPPVIVPLALGASLILPKMFAPAIAWLHISGRGKPASIRTKHLSISGESFVRRPKQGAQRWPVQVVSIVNRKGKWMTEQRELCLASQGTAIRVCKKRKTSIAGEVVSWARCGAELASTDGEFEYLALGYRTGQIELRSLDDPERVVATVYLPSEPHSIAFSRRRERTFLVVSAGEILWFDVSRFMKRNPIESCQP